MPAKKRIPREKILAAALETLREGGMEALNVTSLAARLGCSTQPIYLSFCNMEELKKSAANAAAEYYCSYLEAEVKKEKYPPYKAYGMGYIRFAQEERQLFRLMFLCDGSLKAEDGRMKSNDRAVEMVMRNTGLGRESAELFQAEMWIFVHGIATLIATSYLPLQEETVSEFLTDAYEGLRARFAVLSADGGKR